MHVSTHHALESQAQATFQARAIQSTSPAQETRRDANPNAQEPRSTRSAEPAQNAARLSESDLRQVQQLKARDREVRTHERAHVAAGGSLVRGGASYTYEHGPDGRRYAVGGEVKIETARVPGDPEATAERAEQVRRAALAPAVPSTQDRAVAAQAAALIIQARAEAARAREQEEGRVPDSSDSEVHGNPSATASETVAGGSDSPARAEITLYESIAAIEDDPKGDAGSFESAMA